MVGELLLQPQQSSFIARFHKLVHEWRGGDEAHRQPPLACGQSQSPGHVTLSRSAWSQSDDVLTAFDPITSCKLEHLGLVERGDDLELEAVEALDGGELRRLDAPFDESAFAVDELEFDQTSEDGDVVQAFVGALARDLVVLAMDSRELERLEPMLEQNLGRLAVLVRASLLTQQVRQIHGVLGHDQVQLQSSVACNQRERGFAHTLLFSVEGTPKTALHQSASTEVVTSLSRSDRYRLERPLPGGIRTR